MEFLQQYDTHARRGAGLATATLVAFLVGGCATGIPAPGPPGGVGMPGGGGVSLPGGGGSSGGGSSGGGSSGGGMGGGGSSGGGSMGGGMGGGSSGGGSMGGGGSSGGGSMGGGSMGGGSMGGGGAGGTMGGNAPISIPGGTGAGGVGGECNDGGISGGGIGGGAGCDASGGVGQFPGGGKSAEELDKELDKSLGDFDEAIGDEQREVQSVGRNTEGYGSGSGGGGGTISLGEQEAGASGSSGGGAGGAGGAAGSGNPQSNPLEGMSDEQIAQRTPDDIVPDAYEDVVARQLREAALAEEDPVLRERLWDEYRKYKGLK